MFYFEPLYQVYDETLLGLIRRRYAEVNDHDKDMLSDLRSRSYSHVVRL